MWDLTNSSRPCRVTESRSEETHTARQGAAARGSTRARGGARGKASVSLPLVKASRGSTRRRAAVLRAFCTCRGEEGGAPTPGGTSQPARTGTSVGTTSNAVGLLLNYSISSGDAPILRLRLAVRRASYLRSCKSPGAAEAKGAATPDAASRETPLPLGGMRPPQAGFGRLAVGALFVLRQSPRRYSPRRRLGRPGFAASAGSRDVSLATARRAYNGCYSLPKRSGTSSWKKAE